MITYLYFNSRRVLPLANVYSVFFLRLVLRGKSKVLGSRRLSFYLCLVISSGDFEFGFVIINISTPPLSPIFLLPLFVSQESKVRILLQTNIHQLLSVFTYLLTYITLVVNSV